MSDFARLHQVLTKLAQRERAPGESRHLRGDGAAALLASFVAEIAETILPRRLIFTTDESQSFHFAVANGRLQGVLQPLPSEFVTKLSEIADQPLAEPEDDRVEALHAALLEFFDNAGPVSIQFRKLAGLDFGSDVGVPATLLATTWDISAPELEEFDPSKAFGDYLTWIGEKAVAWLRIEGEEVTDQFGDEGRLGTLGEQAALFLDSYFSKFDELFAAAEGPFVTVLALDSEANTEAVIFVEVEEMSAFIVVKTDAMVECVNHWQSKIVG